MTVFRDARGFELLARAAEVREMDARTIGGHDGVPGVPGRVLMELAGAGAARLIRERAGGEPGKAVVLCGGGNNGGDGYVIARHLADAGWRVRCVATSAGAGLSGDAKANHDLWVALGGEVRSAERGATAAMRNWIGHANAVVDALFGTGLGRDVEGAAAELIAMANDATHGLKVAIDVPSGLDSDTGRVWGCAFRADLTVTFGVAKAGLYTGAGPSLAGEVAVVGIALPRRVVDAVGASARIASAAGVARMLPERPIDGHKGTFGHVGIVGGFPGKEGAAYLAARAALRSGAGLATWVHPASAAGGVARAPEVMSHVLADVDAPMPDRPDIFVVGPGLGADAAGRAALEQALATGKPLVLDADALNILAGDGRQEAARGCVITPHPAEAARLLGVSASDVQADRFAAARRLVDLTGATVVLKGAGTIIASSSEAPVLVALADPTLAIGGTGDVLAGLLGGLMAQGRPPFEAAIAAVWLAVQAATGLGLGHARRGVFPSEVADALPGAIDALLGGWR